MNNPVDGIWNVILQTPLGAQAATLYLSTTGGAITGTMESRLGSGELSKGWIDGNLLRWSANLKFPRPTAVEFNARVDGDSIAGTFSLGALGQAPFKGTRS